MVDRVFLVSGIIDGPSVIETRIFRTLESAEEWAEKRMKEGRKSDPIYHVEEMDIY